MLSFLSIEQCNSQCAELSTYKPYFISNFSKLDRIEGIWRGSYKSKYYYGESLKQETNEWTEDFIIFKDGDEFKCCSENGYFSAENKRAFTSTASHVVYLYNELFTNTNSRVSTNAILYTSNMIVLSYELPYKETVKIFGEDLAHDSKVIEEYKFIKKFPFEDDIPSIVSGTGIALTSNGFILTCNHVVESIGSVSVSGINGNFKKKYSAECVDRIQEYDLAILKITDTSFKSFGPLPFSFTKTDEDVGSNVFVLGYPMRATMGDEIKLTTGIISSASGYDGDVRLYQISAPVQSGNSGGPLFDERGNVTGVVTAKHLNAENANYAFKSSVFRKYLLDNNYQLKLSSQNLLLGKSLSEKVKLAKNYVYIIEVRTSPYLNKLVKEAKKLNNR